MVIRRSITLPSLFLRPWSRRRDLTGRPVSSPVWQPSDRSASPYLRRLGWPLRFRWAIKREDPPAVLPVPSLACFRNCQYRCSCFSLWLALANPPLAHPRCCFAHSQSKLCCHLHQRPTEEVGRRPKRNPSCIADHASVRGDIRVSPLDACSDVPLHRRRSLSSFSFPCTHPSPTPSWTALRQWGEHHVSFALYEFSLSRNISAYIFHFVTFCLIRKCCSNLVDESRDEILFKGGRLWRPRFSAGLINPNDPVNSVDFGQTTVNLGHHLENITDKP
jgi:hypothetical protein